MPGERDADKYVVLSIEEKLLKTEENLVVYHPIHTYRLSPFQPQDNNSIFDYDQGQTRHYEGDWLISQTECQVTEGRENVCLVFHKILAY